MTNIGVFDSGLGGLSVLKKLKEVHKANYFYLGDNLRVPYGDRDSSQILEFSYEIVSFLEKKDIDFYIIACNTMSVVSKKMLEEKFNKKFISITDMGIKQALACREDIGLLATKATCDSHFYKKEIEKYTSAKVHEISCQKLVKAIEEGKNTKEIDELLSYYLEEVIDKKIKNIILGCTHFPIVKENIQRLIPYEVNIFDPTDFLNDNINFKENDFTNIEIYMTKADDFSQKMVNFVMEEGIKIKKAKI